MFILLYAYEKNFRKIIIEKHWRGIISRQIVDVFNDECTKFMNSLPGSMEESGGLSIKEHFFTREDVPPVLETNKYWLLNVLRDDLTWLCPVEREGKILNGEIVATDQVILSL